jgi:hypothetical protein
MNDIGWLFLFMRTFQDNSVLTTLGSPPESSGRSEGSIELFGPLVVEQIIAVREFFELIAKWDEKESSHGN